MPDLDDPHWRDTVTTISQETADAAKKNGEGWCTTCLAFTRCDLSDDDHDRECPVCDQDTVDGLALAITKGYLKVVPTIFFEGAPA